MSLSRAANEWKIELFVENVLNIVILFGGCNDFVHPARQSQRLLVNGDVAGLAMCHKKYLAVSATWALTKPRRKQRYEFRRLLNLT